MVNGYRKPFFVFYILCLVLLYSCTVPQYRIIPYFCVPVIVPLPYRMSRVERRVRQSGSLRRLFFIINLSPPEDDGREHT